jgi:hypothetical protein
MKGLVKVLMVLALAMVICMPGVASADWSFYPTAGFGSPGWQDPGGVKYDAFTTYIASGNTFSNAPIGTDSATFSFTVGGWSGSYVNANTSTASGVEVGPGSPAMQWNYNLSGAGPVYPMTFDIDYYDNGVFQLHEHDVIGSNGTLSVYYTDNNEFVPLPPTLLLLGSGLLGLAGCRRLRKG